MEFPHHHHHGRHRRDDDDDDRRRAPPPSYGRGDADPYAYGGAPPPPYGHGDNEYGRPPPPAYGGGPGESYGRHPPPAYGREDDYGRGAPPPAYGGGGYGGGASEYGNVVHVGHEVGGDRPHYGGGGHGGGRSEYGGEHHTSGGAYGGGGAPPERQQTVRVFCKAGQEYSLAIRRGTVCLVRTNRDDDAQHWIKDMKYSTRVKDEEGYPAFSLINKATGEALKHSIGQSHPVRLANYNPDYLDESILWTESRDVGEGFRCIRMVNNIYLNFDAFHGDKDHGGVHDGTTVVLWEWCEGDNQRWKGVSWCVVDLVLAICISYVYELLKSILAVES